MSSWHCGIISVSYERGCGFETRLLQECCQWIHWKSFRKNTCPLVPGWALNMYVSYNGAIRFTHYKHTDILNSPTAIRIIHHKHTDFWNSPTTIRIIHHKHTDFWNSPTAIRIIHHKHIDFWNSPTAIRIIHHKHTDSGSAPLCMFHIRITHYKHTGFTQTEEKWYRRIKHQRFPQSVVSVVSTDTEAKYRHVSATGPHSHRETDVISNHQSSTVTYIVGNKPVLTATFLSWSPPCTRRGPVWNATVWSTPPPFLQGGLYDAQLYRRYPRCVEPGPPLYRPPPPYTTVKT